VSQQVRDILQRYERMNPNDRHFVSSGFDAVLSGLEDQCGPLTDWNPERKKEIAKQVMQSSRDAFKKQGDTIFAEMNQLGAHGGALLSCYLELQALPGDQAAAVVGTIDAWRQRAQNSGPYASAR
jgi:hypothetical protein